MLTHMFNAHNINSNNLSVKNLILLFFTIVLWFASVITLAQIEIPSTIQNAWQTIGQVTITQDGTASGEKYRDFNYDGNGTTYASGIKEVEKFDWKVLWIADNWDIIYVLSKNLVVVWWGGSITTSGDDGDWTISGSDIYETVITWNVGIGTSTMSGKVHIKSEGQTELYLEENNIWNAANIHLKNRIRTWSIWAHSSPDIFYIGKTGSWVDIAITPLGLVGIGTYIPKANLQVVGNFIAGNYSNTITGDNSSIWWGQDNILIWSNSFIWWGMNNIIDWSWSFIWWWWKYTYMYYERWGPFTMTYSGNKIQSFFSFIWGGISNMNNGDFSFIWWGIDNHIYTWNNNVIVGGGGYNTDYTENAIYNWSDNFIGGWMSNTITWSDSSIVWGAGNKISWTAGWNIIGWWTNNNIIWMFSFIGWGGWGEYDGNKIHWSWWFIWGWWQNKLYGNYGTIPGWKNNNISWSSYWFIWWWESNIIYSATHAFIGWGSGNVITGNSTYSTIPWWYNNYIEDSPYSFVWWKNARAIKTYNTFVRNSANTLFTALNSNTFIINATNGVGIGTNNPSSALDVSGDIRWHSVTLTEDNTSAICSSSKKWKFILSGESFYGCNWTTRKQLD